MLREVRETLRISLKNTNWTKNMKDIKKKKHTGERVSPTDYKNQKQQQQVKVQT